MPYIEDRIVHDADAHIMETPTWLRDHADPAIRDRIQPLQLTPASNEVRQTGDRDSSDFEPPSTAGASTPPTSTAPTRRPRSCCARTSPPPGRSCPRTASGRSTCIGVQSQLVFNTFHNSPAARLGAAPRRPRPRLRRGSGPQPGHDASSAPVDDRLLPTMYVPLADFDRAAAMADEAIDMGAAALLVAVGLSRTATPPATAALDPVWARAAGGRHPDRVPRRRHRRPHRPHVLPERAARSRPTSTAATRTSAASTTWASRARRPRPWPR